jgi:hypothetical protein
MQKALIGGLIGFLVGAALIFFVFVGVPRAGKAPGEPIRPPDADKPAGSAQVVLRQEFFNDILNTIFKDMRAPSFPVGMSRPAAADQTRIEYAAFQAGCESTITILPEGSGVKTGVRFENDKIRAPLAFTGSYNSPFGCLQFTGWAQTALELRFDSAQQALFGRINVETVNLDGINPALSGIVTPMVQSSLNERVNPIQILNGKQIAINMPLASTGGTLNAQVNDMRAEFKDNALNLYVIYAFSGAPVQ